MFLIGGSGCVLPQLDRHASALWRASNDLIGTQNWHWKVNEVHEWLAEEKINKKKE